MLRIGQVKVKGLPLVVLFVCITGWFAGGCASYNVQTQKISQSYELGNTQAAAAQISAEADKRGEGKDAVVWRLEQGAVLRAAERFEESNQAFDKAEELVNKYEEAAKMSVSREAIAAVTNLTTLPYEGFAYDKIMMNTYKALNYLELGDYEKARVELYRAYERQKDAVHINSKRIEKAQEEGEKQNLHVNMDKVNNDNRFKNQFDNYYSDLNQLSAYADYVNPAAVYLDGLFFMTRATGNSDLERSRNSFERVRSMIGENKFIRQDLETVQQVINGQQIPATTYVFFETGQAPEREQIRIDLPLFLITPGVPYVGAAFPKLKYRDNYISALNVSYSGTTEPTLLLASMDGVIAREFKNELPIIITKTLIASAVKAAVTYGASRAASQKNETAKYVTLIAGAIYQAATNQADLRTWTSLPKEFQFCRFPTPADRKIELEPPFSGYKLPVTLNDGLINVVWVKSVNRGSPLLVNQFKLKDETKGTVALPPPEAAIAKEVTQQEPSKPEQLQQIQQAEVSKPEQTVQPSQPEATGQEQPRQGGQPETPKSEQPIPSLQSESSIPVQSTQMPQQEPAKPDEATQENKTEASTEQPDQPSQLESIKSELPTQESRPEVPKHEEPTQSDNNQSSASEEDTKKELSKTEQQSQVLQSETSKFGQSTKTGHNEGPSLSVIKQALQKNLQSNQIEHNEGPSLIGVGLPEEKVTAQIEAERISKIGKTMLKKIDPLLTKLSDSMDNNDWNTVIQTGKELIEIDPENFIANVGLGLAYAMLSEFELSIQYFKKANELIPSSAVPFIGTTFVYARKGDKDKAFEFLKFAIDRGYNVRTLKNDTGFPEDFRNDPRLDSYL